MKKILIMILALALACGTMFALASCDEEVCAHIDTDEDHKCDTCGADYTAACEDHTDADKNGKCDYCDADVEVECDHADEDKNGKCDKCEADVEVVCETCVDDDKNGKCDVCGKTVKCEACVDANADNKCDVCGEFVPCVTHKDNNRDGKCDGCGEKTSCAVHTDANKDGKCDYCADDIECDEHIDTNKDAACDVCGEVIECDAHVDANRDAVCDVCKEALECYHIDRNADKKCDACGAAVENACNPHIDADHNQVCDVCGGEVACPHVDVNKDTKCDYCDTKIACKDCVDANKDAKCDVCGNAVDCLLCTDADKNGKCDVCGKNIDVKQGIAATLEAYKNSTPNKVEINSVINFLDIDYEETVVYALTANQYLVTGYIDGKLATVMTTEYDKVKYVADGATEVVQNFAGLESSVKEFLQGKGTRENGRGWKSDGKNFAPTARNITLNITETNIKRAKYSEALYNNVLTFYVDVDNIDEVFGEGMLVSDSDVKVTIVNNGATITSVTIEYSIESDDVYPAQEIVMKTDYSYDIQKVELPYPVD